MVETTIALADYARCVRNRIEAALESYLGFESAADAPPECPVALAEAMRYAVLGGGKRLRAMLVLLACEACGGREADAMPAACAVEMIHAYSLVHDDLPAMDDDDLRRGRPTCHKQFGEALAVLAGDALLTRAFEIVADDIRPAAVAARCCSELARAAGAEGMVGGQADDIAAEDQLAFEDRAAELAWLEHIHARKTGAMLAVSLRLGALVAGADAPRLAALDAYGRHLGVAFQVADDLLDVRGDEAAVGKRVNKDAQRGKLTYPALLGVEPSACLAAELAGRAVAALAPLGRAAERLEELARYVVERDR